MTPYPLIPPKMYPLVVHKNNVFPVYFKQNSFKNDCVKCNPRFKSAYLKYNNIVFFINKRANLFADIMLSNIVEVFMHF